MIIDTENVEFRLTITDPSTDIIGITLTNLDPIQLNPVFVGQEVEVAFKVTAIRREEKA